MQYINAKILKAKGLKMSYEKTWDGRLLKKENHAKDSVLMAIFFIVIAIIMIVSGATQRMYFAVFLISIFYIIRFSYYIRQVLIYKKSEIPLPQLVNITELLIEESEPFIGAVLERKNTIKELSEKEKNLIFEIEQPTDDEDDFTCLRNALIEVREERDIAESFLSSENENLEPYKTEIEELEFLTGKSSRKIKT